MEKRTIHINMNDQALVAWVSQLKYLRAERLSWCCLLHWSCIYRQKTLPNFCDRTDELRGASWQEFDLSTSALTIIEQVKTYGAWLLKNPNYHSKQITVLSNKTKYLSITQVSYFYASDEVIIGQLKYSITQKTFDWLFHKKCLQTPAFLPEKMSAAYNVRSFNKPRITYWQQEKRVWQTNKPR